MIGAYGGLQLDGDIDQSECQRAFPDCGHARIPVGVSDRFCARKQLICRLWKTNFVTETLKKSPVQRGFCFRQRDWSADFGYVRGLGAFLALHNFELHFIAFGKRLES